MFFSPKTLPTSLVYAITLSRDATTFAEDLVEFLYFAGSLIGATVSGPLALPSLRHFSRVVHTACLAVS
jgi:hypothetical protein